MKKTSLYLIITILLIAGFGYLMLGKSIDGSSNAIPGNSENGQVQKVVLSMKNYNYYPNTIKVKEGQTVRIFLDKSVQGCYRSFTIRSFGIAKYLSTPNDYIEFTPNKKGTYTFACSMGMGTGTLIVE
jgi:plastocyanin domain-containing protein